MTEGQSERSRRQFVAETLHGLHNPCLWQTGFAPNAGLKRAKAFLIYLCNYRLIMKRLKFGLILLFYFHLNLSWAQNLVPNGSFESYSQCPFTSSQIYLATGWFQPHKYPGSNSVNLSSSSDYYNSCYTLNSGPGVPNNGFGFQYANTGSAYIGIAPYSNFSNENAYREYAEVMLNQELIAGKKYFLKYFVSMANLSRFSITKFDAYLSEDSLIYTSSDLYKIPVNPQFQFNGRIADTLNWVEITGSYTAVGGERFLTIGNFQEGYLCDSLRTNVATFVCCSAYYYIDDVSLEEDTITGINEISQVDFSIYPNPSTSTVRISSHQNMLAINLMDLRSKALIRLTPAATKTEIDVSALANGVYIVECIFKSGDTIYKKIVVQN